MNTKSINGYSSTTVSLRIKHWRMQTAGSRISVDALLKKAVWAYFFLLIFEGALRKWILPGLATPLLIIRDPLAIWILVQTFKKRYLRANIYVVLICIVTAIAFCSALVFGHGNLAVALFGARIFIIQFPLIFIIGKIFTDKDVIKMGHWILYLSIPMIVLIVLQFYSPQSAWINQGIGGDESGAGFGGALGYFRPPGTFSFTDGNVQFFSLVGVFVCYFWIKRDQVNKLILVLATAALLFSIPFSISRSLFFSLVLFFLFAAIALSQSRRGMTILFGGSVLLVMLMILLDQFSFVQKAIEVFSVRFETANKVEGGLSSVLIDRYLGGMLSALNNKNAPLSFWGYGLGMGTNVGSVLLTGKTIFLISEDEWGRLIGEMGFLLGLVVIFIRLFLSLNLTIAAFKQLQYKNYLPWMLTAMVLLTLPQGQWGRPSTLGFAVLVAGLCLASFNNEHAKDK